MAPPLSPVVGPCRVLDLSARPANQPIGPEHALQRGLVGRLPGFGLDEIQVDHGSQDEVRIQLAQARLQA